jgi:hypothetical protein
LRRKRSILLGRLIRESQEIQEASSSSAERSDQRTFDVLRETVAEASHQPQGQETLDRRRPLPPREAEKWENVVATEAWQSKDVQDAINELNKKNPGTREWNEQSAEILFAYEEQLEKINNERAEKNEPTINLVSHLDTLARALRAGGEIYVERQRETGPGLSSEEVHRAIFTEGLTASVVDHSVNYIEELRRAAYSQVARVDRRAAFSEEDREALRDAYEARRAAFTEGLTASGVDRSVN